jgi:hypothetical protein
LKDATEAPLATLARQNTNGDRLNVSPPRAMHGSTANGTMSGAQAQTTGERKATPPTLAQLSSPLAPSVPKEEPRKASPFKKKEDKPKQVPFVCWALCLLVVSLFLCLLFVCFFVRSFVRLFVCLFFCVSHC